MPPLPQLYTPPIQAGGAGVVARFNAERRHVAACDARVTQARRENDVDMMPMIC